MGISPNILGISWEYWDDNYRWINGKDLPHLCLAESGINWIPIIDEIEVSIDGGYPK